MIHLPIYPEIHNYHIFRKSMLNVPVITKVRDIITKKMINGSIIRRNNTTSLQKNASDI